MISWLLRYFRRPRSPDEDLLDAYGAVLESAEMFEPMSKPPAGKGDIKAAIIRRARSTPAEERGALLAPYLCLAQFQDSTLKTASQADLSRIALLPEKEILHAVNRLGPQLANQEALTSLVNQDRRLLAREWEQAGL